MFHAFAHTCDREKGHQLDYHKACQAGIETLGLSYRAYIPKEHQLSSLDGNWVPFFPKPYNRYVKRDYLKATLRLFQEAPGPRFFFIETLMRRDVRYFSLAALRHGKPEDHLCMLFRDNGLFKRKRDRRETLFFLQTLKWKFKDHLSLFTDTDNLTHYFEQKTQMPFYTLPVPLDTPVAKASKNPKPLVLFPGEPRKEKGGEWIKTLVSDPHRQEILLACSRSLGIGDYSFENTQSRELYIDWLNRSDVILLPYHASTYRYRSSGIFIEAILFGKLPLVPDHCWMADELKKHDLSDCICDFSQGSVCQKAKKLCNNLEIRERLKKIQLLYRELHTPETFARRLYAVATSSASTSHTLC